MLHRVLITKQSTGALVGQQDERGDSVGGGDRHEGEADHQHPGEEHHHRKASARHQDHCARSVVGMNLM